MVRIFKRKDSLRVPKESRGPRRSKGALREYTEAILIALILALFIRTFIVQAFKIPSGSMIPTLEIGDHILVNKFIYGIRIPYTTRHIVLLSKPKRGDIIVFIYPEDPKKDFIKRVIGVEGDAVEIRNKRVYLNGSPYNDDNGVYTDPKVIPQGFDPRDNFGPVKVPENALFVMGDNRDNSRDSRYWGFVPLGLVKGKAFMIYYSWDPVRRGIRWSRMGDLIH